MVMPLLLGFALGLLSSCGLGGGSLLLIYLLEVEALEQSLAQGVNLLFFLSTVAFSLPSHWKGGFVSRPLLLPMMVGGLCFVVLGSLLAGYLEGTVLRKCFGALLLLLAVGMWRQSKNQSKD